jgi:hypothetical protein
MLTRHQMLLGSVTTAQLPQHFEGHTMTMNCIIQGRPTSDGRRSASYLST